MHKLLRALPFIIIVSFIGYYAYNEIVNWHNEEIATAVTQEREKHEKNIGKLEDELSSHEQVLIPEDKLLEIFGKKKMFIFSEAKTIKCSELEENIQNFFSYLDRENYKLQEESYQRSYDMFIEMVKDLSNTSPILTAETRDILSLTRNTAHLYRVLGEKRIRLIKQILKNENTILEHVLANFYLFYISKECCKEGSSECLSFKFLYEYSGFFLNTLGGKSYLLRRDSRIRILATYYCILILDNANEATLNYYGIDIYPYIDFAINEINNQKNLIYHEEYVARLVNLKEKYQR